MDYVSPRGRDGKAKAVNFGLYAKEHGWSGKWNADPNDETIIRLFARRGENETLEVTWYNGSIISGGEPTYTLAGERIKVRNLSAAAKIVAGRPDPDRLNKAQRRRNRKQGITYEGDYVSPEAIEGLQGSLPFDSESNDDELEAVLHGRTITWINRLSGQLDSAFVNADKQFEVKRNGRDQISFVDSANGGYRAVYLDSIVSVG